MQTAIAVFLVVAGIALFYFIIRMMRQGLNSLGSLSAVENATSTAPATVSEGPISADELMYLYAHDFVAPVKPRAMGVIVRDRAFACLTGDELDPDDFARQMLYAVLTELHRLECIQVSIVNSPPTYMPPYPTKQWELQLRQTSAFPSGPLFDSLAVGFDLCRRHRSQGEDLTPDKQFFTLDEVLERALKAIRQEMSFWEKGGICSDLRTYVAHSLVARGYLIPHDRETWLDRVRTKPPAANEPAVEKLALEARSLARRLETFRKMYGSAVANAPETDENGQRVDIDPEVVNAVKDLADLPLDDCLRLTINEAVTAIKQLEPSGEAGI